MSDVFLAGRLASDPVQRGNNGPVVVRLVVNRSTKDKNTGEWKDNSSFFDVVAWREKGTAALQLRKGQDVLVHGRLDQSDFEHEGVKRQKVEILLDRIGPEIKVQREQQQPQAQPQYQAPPPVYQPQPQYQPQQPPPGYQPPPPPVQYQPPPPAQPQQPAPTNDDDIPW